MSLFVIGHQPYYFGHRYGMEGPMTWPVPLKRFRHDESGAIAILFALLMPVVLGAVGFGVEVGSWYAARRELQSAVDAAAVAAAIEKYNGSSTSTITSEATTEAQRNGFTTSGGGTIVVNIPPTSGSYTGDSLAVEVRLTKPIQTLFLRYLVQSTSVTASTRAVAKMQMQAGNGCVVALNSSASGAFRITGTVTVSLLNCDVVTNSSSSTSLIATGGTLVTADCVRTVGATADEAHFSTTSCGGVQEGARKYADPYEDRSVPAFTGCDHNNLSINSSGTNNLSPGTYCGGITASGNNSINLSPGTYVMYDGAFNVSGSGTISGNGVSIILMGSSASNVGNIDFTGTRTVNMSAPTSGAYSGMLFYQSEAASSSGTNRITGGTNFNITGAVYTPKRKIDYSGNSGGGTSCVQLIGDTVEFTGTSGANSSNCGSAGVTLAGANLSTLVE
ncbi:MAG: pilus assembly protein [Magnetospirillum sp. WYHS-4]